MDAAFASTFQLQSALMLQRQASTWDSGVLTMGIAVGIAATTVVMIEEAGMTETEIGTDTTMIVATIGIGTATTATIVTLKTGGTSALLVEVAIHLVAEVALVPLAVQARPALKKDHAGKPQ
ncbi:hypothetical protein FRC16_009202 [Serendipita sp. 398]|nr:hypothetical protein FRC16_009202 [Serendipita sp. 398]